MPGITVGPPGQPGTSILLAPPTAAPGITDDERRTIAEMMAKGTFGWVMLAMRTSPTPSSGWQAGGADVVQEPAEQYWGTATAHSATPPATWSAFRNCAPKWRQGSFARGPGNRRKAFSR